MAGPIQLIGLPSVYPNAREITFNGATGENKINLGDNLANALSILEGSNNYLKFVTTDNSESVTFGKLLTTLASATGSAGFTLPSGTAPSSPVSGDVWFDGSNFIGYDGVANRALDVQSVSGGGFTDDGAVVRLTTAADQLHLGAATSFTGKFKVTGDTLLIGALDVLGSISTFSRADATPAGTADTIFNDGVFGSTDTVNTGISILGSGQVGIAFGDAADINIGQIRYQNSSNTLEFVTNTAIQLTIGSSRVLTFNGTARIDTGGNALLTLAGGTAGVLAENFLSVTNTTAPSATANLVHFGAYDDAAGHTIPAFQCEGTNVIATSQGDSVSSVRVKMRINGVTVTLLAI